MSYHCKGCGATVDEYQLIDGNSHAVRVSQGDDPSYEELCGPVVEVPNRRVKSAPQYQSFWPRASWTAPTQDVEGDAACQ